MSIIVAQRDPLAVVEIAGDFKCIVRRVIIIRDALGVKTHDYHSCCREYKTTAVLAFRMTYAHYCIQNSFQTCIIFSTFDAKIPMQFLNFKNVIPYPVSSAKAGGY